MKNGADHLKAWFRRLDLLAVVVIVGGLFLYTRSKPDARLGPPGKAAEDAASNRTKTQLDQARASSAGGSTKAPRKGGNHARLKKNAAGRDGDEETKEELVTDLTFPVDETGPPPKASDRLDEAAREQPASRPPGARMSSAAWKYKLNELHRKVDAKAPRAETLRAEAETELAKIDDPNAAQPIWDTFGGHVVHHSLIARLLGGITSGKSTTMLAALAVYSPDESARGMATKALIGRKAPDYAKPLIGLINEPMKHQRGSIDTDFGRMEVLFIEGERVDRQFLYPVLQSRVSPGCGWNVYTADNPYMLPAARETAEQYNRQQEELARNMTRDQIESDMKELKRLNDQIVEMKRRAIRVLTEASGFRYQNREEWESWLAHQTGQTYVPPRNAPKPTFTQVVSPLYQPEFIGIPQPT